jgi:hypothetical protein
MGQTPPTPPFVTTPGPAGATDQFMEITADTMDNAGSRVVAINGAQWAGNFLAAGVGRISMDLRNLGGATALTVRLLFEDPMNGPPADEAVTNFGAVLPVGSGWMHFDFPILPGNLTALTGSAATALSNATLMRIINAPVVGDAAQQMGVLGVDNITAAAAIPEPSSALFVLAGGGLLAVIRRKRAAKNRDA